MLGSRGTSGMGGIGGALSGIKDKLDGGDDVAQADVSQFDLDDDTAIILVRAMCNAAKADGHVDDTEINNIISRAGDIDAEDEALIRAELSAPLDLAGFIATVPQGMEAEVYTLSLLPIEVDTLAEANYLADLRSGLGLSDDQVREIHEGLGIPLG